MYGGTKQNPDSRGASRTPVRRLGTTAITVSAAATTLVLGGSLHAFAEPSPPTTITEQTDAVVKPSIVFVHVGWKGVLTEAPFYGENLAPSLAAILGETGAPVIQTGRTCSGFIANPDGQVVTAGHCVQEDLGKQALIQAAVSDLVAGLKDHGYTHEADLVESEEASFYHTWTIQGAKGRGSGPERVVAVYPTVSGSAATTAYQATVPEIVPFDDGDVALLRITPKEGQGTLPALEVAPGSMPNTRTPVLAAGYPGKVTAIVDPNSAPSLISGAVSSHQSVNHVPFFEIDATTNQGMSGGPVVDPEGRVLGVVSFGPAGTGEHGFITATSTVRDLLNKAGVNATLSPTDQAYRAGLAEYFAGNYHSAITEFDTVVQAQPDNAQAKAFLSQAREKAPPESSGLDWWAWLLIGLGVLAVLAGGAFLFLRRRRGATGAKPPTDRQEPRAAERQEPPTPRQEPRAAERQQPPPMERHQPPTEQQATGDRAAAGPTRQFCPQCGEPHNADARFCASCGSRFPAPPDQGGPGSG